MVVITEYKGYTVQYDDLFKKFVATQDGAEIATATLQTGLEAALDRVIAANKKLPPIKVIKAGFEGFYTGTLTSYDSNDKSVWFSPDEKTGLRGRERIRLDSDRPLLHEATEANLARLAEIRKLERELSELRDQILRTKQGFETPITAAYIAALKAQGAEEKG